MGRILLPTTARDLRRTVGEEAVQIIEHHSEVLLTQQQVIGKLVLQVESLTQQVKDLRGFTVALQTRLGAIESPTFWRRLRWLAGR